MNPKVISAEQGYTVSVIGNKMTIRLHGRDTGGTLSMVESIDIPDEGPPPHIHQREDEIFHVLDGVYEFTCGKETFYAAKGATMFAPRGIPHFYRQVGPAPGRLLITITPAGFEEFFEEVGGLSPEQQQIPRVIEIGTKYGLKFLAPTQ